MCWNENPNINNNIFKDAKKKDIDSLFVHIIVLVCPWCIKFSIIYTSRLQCTKNEFCWKSTGVVFFLVCYGQD